MQAVAEVQRRQQLTIAGATPARALERTDVHAGDAFRTRKAHIERGLVFAIPCALYLTVAGLLVFRFASFDGDAQSRVANAYYVLFSRDPHLAAMGFVWNPLPSLVVLGFLPLKALWPALTTRAFIGNIASAVFMAGAAYQIYEFCRDLGLRRAARIGTLALFVVNPMIVYYAANGMSEGLFLFTLILATRYLARWLTTDRTAPLVVAATALALAYLTREEAVFAAFPALLLVLLVAFKRTNGRLETRMQAAILDGAVFILPFVTCFIGWAVVSWVIVGHPFEQLSSVYGNASQLQLGQTSSKVAFSMGQALTHALTASFLLAPIAPAFAFLAIRKRTRTRDVRAFAPLAVLGGVLIFEIGAHTAGATFPWLRYYIASVPLLVMLAAVSVSRLQDSVWLSSSRLSVVRRLPAKLCVAVVIAATAASLPSTAWAMSLRSVGYEERLHLGYVFNPGTRDPLQAKDERLYSSATAIAHHLDSMRLPDGAILVDNFTPCIAFIILASSHPQQFVIPTDRDFKRSLQAPDVFHVRYLMVPPPVELGRLDALNRTWRSLYKNGDEIGLKVDEFDVGGCPHFRLYRVVEFTT